MSATATRIGFADSLAANVEATLTFSLASRWDPAAFLFPCLLSAASVKATLTFSPASRGRSATFLVPCLFSAADVQTTLTFSPASRGRSAAFYFFAVFGQHWVVLLSSSVS
jgi:hypothetical protein